ncbi:MAG: hypothetical protein HKN29_00560 [Rhodothermales bacterium]|nr:hypothetical protein [Rhodothermales bacterium]
MAFLDPDPPVTYRPLSLTVIGWYHAVTGFLGILFAWVPATLPSATDTFNTLGMDPGTMVAFGLASNIVYAAAGMAILKRRDWGRILLLVALPSIMVASAFFNPGFKVMALVSGAVTLGVLAFFLTRPAANDYFSGAVLEAPDSLRRLRLVQRSEGSGNDLKRIFGVLLAVPGWWILSFPLIFGLIAFHRSVFSGGSGLPLGIFSTITFLIAVGLLALGVVLWGTRRWRGYLGWGVVAFGLLAAWMGLLGFLPMDVERFLPPDSLDDFDPEEFARGMRIGARYAIAVAGITLSSGTLLLSAQRRHDLDAAEEIED